MKLTRYRKTRMYDKALRQRWPITAEHRAEIVRHLTEVIADPDAANREKIQACRALLLCEGQNQIDEHKAAVSNDDRNRFREIAERLGIGNSLN